MDELKRNGRELYSDGDDKAHDQAGATLVDAAVGLPLLVVEKNFPAVAFVQLKYRGIGDCVAGAAF
jgi:hypothetical protein